MGEKEFKLHYFNVGLELRSGLLLTVWELLLRVVRMYAVPILIIHLGNGSRFGSPTTCVRSRELHGDTD